jgi:hypothetical protein
MSTTNIPSTNITLQDAMETTYLRRTIVCTIGRLHMFFLSSNICCIIYNYILMIILLPFFFFTRMKQIISCDEGQLTLKDT